jgi:hypothetical protein
MMDRMFDPLFMEPSREHVTLFWVQEPQQAPHFLVDSMTAKAAQNREPEEIPDLASELQLYGKQMTQKLGQDSNSFHYSMARRLTELDAKTIQHHVHLPFGCQKNRCLRQAFEEGKLSSGCKSSIQDLESTFVLEKELEQRQDAFLAMMWVYIVTLCVLLCQLVRKLRSQGSKRALRLRILQAVFSNPEIKRQVEDDLGQSVGNVPPVSLYALRLMGSGGRDLQRALRCMRRVHKLVFASLMVLVVVAPFWVLPICILISIFRVVELCRIPTQGDPECECCCCGANTSDAKKGNLTQEQECCGCCKGSGVCAPSCADCCGPKNCCGCCCSSCGCCEGDCDCCSNGVKAPDDCTCCCCGATAAQARDGTLTEEQACCGCCKGTGTCSDACASCCGKGGCCCCCGATVAQAAAGLLTEAQACCCCCNGTGKCCCSSCSKPSKKAPVVDDCTCCCCGATAAQAKAGTLTEAQACCCCCKGTGTCSAACASCCGGGGGGSSCCPKSSSCALKGRGEKHVVSARNEVYFGIPLQIV